MDIDIAALKNLTKERGLALDYVVESIEQALLVAYLHSTGAHESARVELDRTSGHVVVTADELDDDGNKIGEFDATPAGFGRVCQRFEPGSFQVRWEIQGLNGSHISYSPIPCCLCLFCPRELLAVFRHLVQRA